jgi:hypothetical protein
MHEQVDSSSQPCAVRQATGTLFDEVFYHGLEYVYSYMQGRCNGIGATYSHSRNDICMTAMPKRAASENFISHVCCPLLMARGSPRLSQM